MAQMNPGSQQPGQNNSAGQQQQPGSFDQNSTGQHQNPGVQQNQNNQNIQNMMIRQMPVMGDPNQIFMQQQQQFAAAQQQANL